MAIKNYNPTSPGRRDSSVLDYSEITTSTPHKALLVSKKHSAGRNAQGKLAIWRRIKAGAAAAPFLPMFRDIPWSLQKPRNANPALPQKGSAERSSNGRTVWCHLKDS